MKSKILLIFYRGKTHKRDVVQFAKNQASICFNNQSKSFEQREASYVLWQVLAVMVQQNGVSIEVWSMPAKCVRDFAFGKYKAKPSIHWRTSRFWNRRKSSLRVVQRTCTSQTNRYFARKRRKLAQFMYFLLPISRRSLWYSFSLYLFHELIKSLRNLF